MLTTSRLLLMTTIGDSPTRLGERRCSTELLPPPSTSSNQPLPLLYSPPPSASQAQSFLLQVSSKPTEKGEEGGRPLSLGYNPTLCLSLLYLSLRRHLHVEPEGLHTFKMPICETFFGSNSLKNAQEKAYFSLRYQHHQHHQHQHRHQQHSLWREDE